MLQQRVSFYESLTSPTMDEDPKFTFIKKKSNNTQSFDESRVKKLIFNFTEIKRPHHAKSRSGVNVNGCPTNSFKQRTTKSNTLPKVKSRTRGDFKSAHSSMRKQREKELGSSRKTKGKEETSVTLRHHAYRRMPSVEVRKTAQMFEALEAANQLQTYKNKKLEKKICNDTKPDARKEAVTPEDGISIDKVISNYCDFENRKISEQEFKFVDAAADSIVFDFPQTPNNKKKSGNEETSFQQCSASTDHVIECDYEIQNGKNYVVDEIVSDCPQFPETEETCKFLKQPKTENSLHLDLKGNDNVISSDCNHQTKTRLVNENNSVVNESTDCSQFSENGDGNDNYKKQDFNATDNNNKVTATYENWPLCEKLLESSTSCDTEENDSTNDEDNSDSISTTNSNEDEQQLLVEEIERLSLTTTPISDDEYGLNGFDEDGDDNYVIEAYNEDGKELIFTIFEIKHTASLECENDEVFNDLVTNSDMVIHENESKNSIEVLKDMEIPSEPDDDVKSDNVRFSVNTEDSGIGTISARSTLYSVNSSNSLDELTEDGDIDDDFYVNQPYERSIENVLDNQGNVRISRAYSSLDLTKLCEVNGSHKDKLSYIVEEFINTEEQYIVGLDKVVKQYKSYVEANSPNHLIGKASYLFGNIESICKESKQFLELLHGQPNVEGIAKAIIISASMFELYPKYSKNKPTADIYLKDFDPIIKARQNELGDRLDLASYLLTPIQRLGKYILMLENIQKELTKTTNSPDPKIRDALEIIRREMKKGNDSIAIDSIKSCSIDLALQGSFKMREKFNVLKPRKGEYMLFLFENIIVFTQNVSKNLEEFTYIESIRMSDLSIAPLESEPLTFHLWDYSKVKKATSDRTFVLEAKTPKIKQLWTKSIEKRLWEQLEQARMQQKQLHGDQGKRFSKVDLPIRKSRSSKGDSKKTKSLHRTTSIFYDVHSINAP